jgi:uncharacterized protein
VKGDTVIDTFSTRQSRYGEAFRTIALAATVLAAGCSFLQPAPDHSRYFVLSSAEATPVQSHDRPDIHLGLGPVKLPGYLDTQNIVRTGAGGSVDYLPDAFWAESLNDAFARALLYRTSARIGTSYCVAYPWYSTTRVDYKVPVDVLRFEATSDGRAVLVARWSVEREATGTMIASTESVLEETAGSDPAIVVDALNRCIDRLADAIAAAVAQAPPASRPSQTSPGKPRPQQPARE